MFEDLQEGLPSLPGGWSWKEIRGRETRGGGADNVSDDE